MLADAPVSDDDNVSAHVFRWRLWWRPMPIQATPEARRATQERFGGRDEPEHKGIEQDRENRGAQYKRILLRGEYSDQDGRLRQQERELANLTSTRRHD